MKVKLIDGGVCAAKGYKASGVHCGIRKNKTKRDLALIISDTRAAAAAVYTQNLVKGAPIYVTKANIEDGYAQAVICNSGNANTCNSNGIEIAEAMCELVASHANISSKDVIVASTGVIGQPLSIEPIKSGMPSLVAALGENSDEASEAIMTTDVKKKEVAISFTLGGKECRLGGIAKGSGMINPNMATMLVFLTCDAAIKPNLLKAALSEVTKETFNMISVDGDTSTNDMVSILSNGKAGNPEITEKNADFRNFKKALYEVMSRLSKAIAADGEGATKLLECRVTGAKTIKDARLAAKAVICSNLFKAAMFGADANWGRVLCAIGYSGAKIDVTKVGVSFSSNSGSVKVCEMGAFVPFSEEEAAKVLSQNEIIINVTLDNGKKSATAWGCDLTYDYVKINGDYRT